MPKRDHNGALPIGTVLGDAYRLVRRLAEGGMSMVYEAEQLRLRKRCAVKVMARELAANREALSRASTARRRSCRSWPTRTSSRSPTSAPLPGASPSW